MKRRDFFKVAGAGSLSIMSGIEQLSATVSENEKEKSGAPVNSEKPDVLIIFTDDHNPNCVGYAANSEVKTPNISKLAREGVIFENCYTTATVCMPSRCSLISGLYCHNHHLWGNSRDFHISPHLAPMFRDIKNAGLTTAQIGKFHYKGGSSYQREFKGTAEYYKALGLDYAMKIPSPFNMKDGGFGPYKDIVEKKGLLQEYKKDMKERLLKNQWMVRPSVMSPECHNDSFITDKAIEFISKQPQNQPYCMMVSFAAPHTPLDASGKYSKMYSPEQINLPPNIPGEFHQYNRKFNKSDIRNIRANFFGKVTLIDDNVGRIIAETKKRGRWDNTLVIFAADQGVQLGNHGILGKAWFFEETVKVPLIMRWPQKIESGQRTRALCQLFDVYPTIVEALGGKLTGNGHFARSLLPIAIGESDKVRNYVVSEHSNGSDLDYMIRTEKYKWFDERGKQYLFDLEKDPFELNNLIDSSAHKELAATMKQKYLKFLLDTQYNYSAYYLPLVQRMKQETK